MTVQSAEALPISERLAKLAKDAPEDAVSLNWILSQLHERAFGLFLLVLALPCCIPFLYGVPQIVAFPLMFIAAQILMGRASPWLPERLGNRTVTKASLSNLAERADSLLGRIEALSRPRLVVLTCTPLDRLVGLVLVLFSASILVPLPATNTVPALAVVVVSMGLLQRDGILVVLGSIMGTVWIATLIFAGATVITLSRSWLGL
jgi:hypothetical protein